MKCKRYNYLFTSVLIGLFLLLIFDVKAQQMPVNSKFKWVKLNQGFTFKLDSLSIIPSSIKILQPSQDSALQFSYDLNTGKLQLKSNKTDVFAYDSVFIAYQVFPFSLHHQYFNRDIAVYDSNAYYKDPNQVESRYGIRGIEKRDEIFATQGINKTGNISRGLSFGNTQNVFVNSSLNLQLEGMITPDLKLTAAISDRNIPIQPEGNTQQIQQFDRVYMQLDHKMGRLTAGDLVLKNGDTYFLKYFKNVQGGFVQSDYKVAKNSNASTAIGASVAKGKFASLTLEVKEGVQGPYRLVGPNNERFIIVIANSEKLYLDGKLLNRGFNYDYVIDYNSAEITFTAGVVITKFSRVRVDYEYSERNYSRTNLVLNHHQNIGKFNFALDYYSEEDNPNKPLTLSLSQKDIEILHRVGDTLFSAASSGVDSAAFNANQVLYTDTVLNGQAIYMYSIDPNKARFRIVFSEVGPHQGDYIKTSITANGQVYEYKPPFAGKKQGNFAPVRVLPTPKKKNMAAIALAYEVNKNDKVYFEGAISKNDINLFSDIDKKDDDGKAFKVGYQNGGIAITKSSAYKLSGGFDYEYLDKYFNPIDRFRNVDFDRDWSASTNTTLSTTVNSLTLYRAEDHIVTGKVRLAKDGYHKLNYNLTYRDKGTDVLGYQHRVDLLQQYKFMQLNADYFQLSNKTATISSSWQRLNVSPSFYLGKYLQPGYTYSIDKNQVTYLKLTDSVGTVMNYEQHKFFIKSLDTSKTKFGFDYAYREDYLPKKGVFYLGNIAKTANINVASQLNKTNYVGVLFTYRNLVNKPIADNSKPVENTIMGRIDWNADLLKRHIRSEITLVSSNGRELKRAYVYIPVATGQGNYVWNDLNKDGVQQLNEFLEKVYNDPNGEFIRSFVPTNEYRNAYSNSLNYRLNVTAPRSWRDKGFVKNVISKFSSVLSWTLDKKITSSDLQERFNPFAKIIDTALLSSQSNFRSTTFFNRSNPSYGLDYVHQNVFRKQLLTNGFETRKVLENQLNARANFLKIFNAKLGLISTIKALSSDYLANRNYTLQSYQIKPELAFQPIDNFRLTAGYIYNTKQNIFGVSGENAQLHEFSAESRISKVTTRTITANVKLIKITFVGDVNTAVAYEMLEALRPGDNYTWTVNWQEKLTSGLQLTFSYEGRKSENVNVIHLGRMQLSALF